MMRIDEEELKAKPTLVKDWLIRTYYPSVLQDYKDYLKKNERRCYYAFYDLAPALKNKTYQFESQLKKITEEYDAQQKNSEQSVEQYKVVPNVF